MIADITDQPKSELDLHLVLYAYRSGTNLRAKVVEFVKLDGLLLVIAELPPRSFLAAK